MRTYIVCNTDGTETKQTICMFTAPEGAVITLEVVQGNPALNQFIRVQLKVQGNKLVRLS